MPDVWRFEDLITKQVDNSKLLRDRRKRNTRSRKKKYTKSELFICIFKIPSDSDSVNSRHSSHHSTSSSSQSFAQRKPTTLPTTFSVQNLIMSNNNQQHNLNYSNVQPSDKLQAQARIKFEKGLLTNREKIWHLLDVLDFLDRNCACLQPDNNLSASVCLREQKTSEKCGSMTLLTDQKRSYFEKKHEKSWKLFWPWHAATVYYHFIVLYTTERQQCRTA